MVILVDLWAVACRLTIRVQEMKGKKEMPLSEGKSRWKCKPTLHARMHHLPMLYRARCSLLSLHGTNASGLNTSLTMCTKYWRKYRCGHRSTDRILYCKDSTSFRGKKALCHRVLSETAVYDDSSLCGQKQCYRNSLRESSYGWTCCECGRVCNITDYCRGDVGAPQNRFELCLHEVCTKCKYSCRRDRDSLSSSDL